MPAGFNKGQVEYIKAIANVNGHKTYKVIRFPDSQQMTPDVTHGFNDLRDSHNTFLTYKAFVLGKNPTNIRDSAGNLGTLALTELDAFSIPKAANSDGAVYEGQREGDEGFLESTHLRLRCVLPNDSAGDFTGAHGEYRMIVFRARDRQAATIEHAVDQSNWRYSLFRGTSNYNIGFNGYEKKESIQGTVDYDDQTSANRYDTLWVSHDGAMNLPVNKESWVVMKDHRFFLGKEYGGKNIYETTLHWNWQDPLATASDDVTEGIEDKNFTWYILIMGSTNNFDDSTNAQLNIKITGTTHMTSG